jgi:hypothetical protein
MNAQKNRLPRRDDVFLRSTSKSPGPNPHEIFDRLLTVLGTAFPIFAWCPSMISQMTNHVSSDCFEIADMAKPVRRKFKPWN